MIFFCFVDEVFKKLFTQSKGIIKRINTIFTKKTIVIDVFKSLKISHQFFKTLFQKSKN